VPAGRTREYLVAREADLPALAALLRPPAGEALAAFRQQARVARRFCDEHGMLLAAGYPGVGDPMVWMSGVEPLLLAAHDEPGFVDAYAAVVADWSRAIVGLLLDAGVDVVVRRGWYESTDFWSPELYRRHLFGPVAAEVRAAHQAGARVSYVMNSGSRPLWPLFGELGFDLLANVDPAAPGVDLAALRTAIGGRISVCGGVNNTHVLEQGSVAEVERAVRHAIDALGGHPGFVLAPGDSVGYAPGTDQAVAERNVQAMIATWRELTA
jgi:hypothetical protein